MKKDTGYLILVVPLLEEELSDSLWLNFSKIVEENEVYVRFDWTSEIRETFYYDSFDVAQQIVMKYAKTLNPIFCSVIEMSMYDIRFLGINKGKKLENLRLLEY